MAVALKFLQVLKTAFPGVLVAEDVASVASLPEVRNPCNESA